MNPPVIVIHGNSLEHVTDAYKRFLEGRFRDAFKLVGTPLRIEMQTRRRIRYADKRTPTSEALVRPRRLSRLAAARGHAGQRAVSESQHGAYREQQRATATRPVSEHAAQGARAGLDLPRQRHQAAGPDRIVRPVRRAAAQHRHADGLQARDLHRRARPRRQFPRRAENGRATAERRADATAAGNA